ncbi:MAG: RagB/SusD family nutrient uptake outer membrane protein [Anaerovoracaceae bacterium]
MNILKYKATRLLLTSVVVCLTMLWVSCVKDLNVKPISPQLKPSDIVYKSLGDYKQGLAFLYGEYIIAVPDLGSFDATNAKFNGYTTFTRAIWMLQEAWTDEAWWIWYNDSGIPDFINASFNNNSIWTKAFYYRLYYLVLPCNQFLKDASDAELTKKGIPDADRATIAQFRNEARFLRALAYYYGLDFFRRVPFVTEKDPIGAFLPKQSTAQELYSYIETELKDIVEQLPTPSSSTYGKVDKACVYALLAKLYLNSGVYLGYDGTAKNTSVRPPTSLEMDSTIKYCDLIINDGYHRLSTTSISPAGKFTPYQELFMGDNGQNDNARREFIFTLLNDYIYTHGDGGGNFAVAVSMPQLVAAHAYGINATKGWSSMCARSTLLNLFNIPLDASTTIGEKKSPNDDRGWFYNKGLGYAISANGTLLPPATNTGYAPVKFRANYANYTITPYPPDILSSTNRIGDSTTFLDYYNNTDYAMFRMGDIILMKAEALWRKNGGTNGQTDVLVQQIRSRAHNNIPASGITLEDLRTERAKELYHEGHRRTDLIRFNSFTGSNYLWEYKGGVEAGRAIDPKYTILPIPFQDIVANSNITQNYGF